MSYMVDRFSSLDFLNDEHGSALLSPKYQKPYQMMNERMFVKYLNSLLGISHFGNHTAHRVSVHKYLTLLDGGAGGGWG